MKADDKIQRELAIDRAWDRFVSGRDVDTGSLNLADEFTLRALHATGDAINADPVFVQRLRREILGERPIAAGVHPSPPTLAPVSQPRRETSTPPNLVPRRARSDWQRFAVATLVLLVGLVGFAGFFDNDQNSGETRLPAASYATSPTIASGTPVLLTIESIGVVNAPIERARAIDQVSKDSWAGDLWTVDPSGAWVVAWLNYTDAPGMGGNVVLAGHLDYWDVGPAIFSDLAKLTKGDRVEVTSADGAIYAYTVDWSRTYPLKVDAEQQQAVLGPTTTESLTLITSAGEFDDKRGEYKETLVVRATLESVTMAAPVDATPRAN